MFLERSDLYSTTRLIKYSKNSNIVKYYYNWIGSILIFILLKKHVLLSMLSTILLLYIFVETVIHYRSKVWGKCSKNEYIYSAGCAKLIKSDSKDNSIRSKCCFLKRLKICIMVSSRISKISKLMMIIRTIINN